MQHCIRPLPLLLLVIAPMGVAVDLKLRHEHEYHSSPGPEWRCGAACRDAEGHTSRSLGWTGKLVIKVTTPKGRGLPHLVLEAFESMAHAAAYYVAAHDLPPESAAALERHMVKLAKDAVRATDAPIEVNIEHSEQLIAQFGLHTHRLRAALSYGGSELGTGQMLFALAVTIRAASILEVGRYKGFSTLALAAALQLQEIGWQEPDDHKQRPEMNYTMWEARSRRGRLVSLDVNPSPQAARSLQEAGLEAFVEMLNISSQHYTPTVPFDLMFIDGDHSYSGLLADCERLLPHLRPGGYFIIHDYYGWYDEAGHNKSPIREVAHLLARSQGYEQILLDTGYMSFVMFRKPYDAPAMISNNLPRPECKHDGAAATSKVQELEKEMQELRRELIHKDELITKLSQKLGVGATLRAG